MRTRTMIRAAAAIAVLAIVMVPTGTAHPASWQARGTAVGEVTFEITLVWGRSDTILDGDGAGYTGFGDGFYILSQNGLDAPPRPFVAFEATHGMLFTSAEWCDPFHLQRAPDYSLQGPGIDLRGTYEFCWSSFVERVVMDGTVDGFTVHIEK